jgi:hypothetical protein
MYIQVTEIVQRCALDYRILWRGGFLVGLFESSGIRVVVEARIVV